MTWTIVGTTVVHTVSLDGRTAVLRDIVGSADILREDLLRVDAVRNGRVALISTLQLVDDRIRAVWSESPTGQIYYAGGIELATGKPSLIDERCAAMMS